MPSKGERWRGRAGGNNTDNGRGKQDGVRNAAVPAVSRRRTKPGLDDSQPDDAAFKRDRKGRADRRGLARQLQLENDAITRLRVKLGREERECTRIRRLHDEVKDRLGRAEDQVKWYEAAAPEYFRLPEPSNLQPYLREMIQAAVTPLDYTKGARSDLEVELRWRDITSKICSLSSNFFTYSRPWDSLAPELQEKLAHLTPEARQFMEDKNRSPGRLYEAWIWRALVETLFPDMEPAEGPRVGEYSEHWAAYTHLQRLAEPHLTTREQEDTPWTIRYRIWRNLTMGIILHVTEDKTRISPDFVVNALKNELDPFYRANPEYPEMNREFMHETIERLAQSAVELDVCMQLDRGDWSVASRHPDTGALFGFPLEAGPRPDGFRMLPGGIRPSESIPLAMVGRNVQLIVSPQLRKRRNWYGCANDAPDFQMYPIIVETDEPDPPSPCEGEDGVAVDQGTSSDGS